MRNELGITREVECRLCETWLRSKTINERVAEYTHFQNNTKCF